MTFANPWLAGSASGFLSDIDTTGLDLPDKTFASWLWATISVSTTTPTAILTYTIPASVTTDCCVFFDCFWMSLRDGAAAGGDNAWSSFNRMTQSRVGSTLTTDAFTGGNIMQMNTSGNLAAPGTITWASVGGAWELRFTAGEAKAQKVFFYCKVFGICV
jgi:hypothetical protein